MPGAVALVDYGAGNLQSVRNALVAAGAKNVCVTSDPETVFAAERIILPGVGAFAHCMSALAAIPGMIDALGNATDPTRRAAPFLGICVGMQLMAEAGEEHGRHAGLGWISGTVRPLVPADPLIKVPHMGWNDVVPCAGAPLIVPGEAYFLHSYAFDGDDVCATSDHGGTLTAAIARDNRLGVQFHPEKSQRYGLALLEKFLEWRP